MRSDDPQFICPHVAGNPDEFLVWFTGVGKGLNWACRACTERYPEPPSEWVPATEAWLSKYRDKVYWDGIRGSPEIKRRSAAMRFSSREVQLGGQWGDFVDVRPCQGKPSCWLALSKSGSLILFSSADSSVLASWNVAGLKFEITAETGLCVSPQNDFVVISEASGPNAVLVNAESGQVIKELSRGKYRCENSHFPVAFFIYEGAALLIAGSDWNRLDIYDPATGNLLTERGPTSYVEGVRPPHYLDFFHGSLRVSPDSRRVVDGGWVWAPVGCLRSWNLAAWISNVWESEDGPTVKTLACRDYFWDGPMCWVDSTTVAFWGWGRDDEWLMPAIVLMDAGTGDILRWFPGSRVRQPGAWPPRELSDSLFFDRYIFAVSDEKGTSVWDIETGECLLVDASVKPWRYHPDSKEFLEVLPDGFKVSALIG